MKKRTGLAPEEQFVIAYELQEEQIEPSDTHVREEVNRIATKEEPLTREDLWLVYRIAMSYAHTIVHEDALERKWKV